MCHDAAAIRTEAAGEVAQVVCTSITYALFTHPQPCITITTSLTALEQGCDGDTYTDESQMHWTLIISYPKHRHLLCCSYSQDVQHDMI